MKKIWEFLGNIQFTIIIFLLLVCDLSAGWLSLTGNEKIFKSLGDFGLIKWIGTFGKTYPFHSIWFFVLLILLVLLGINTFVCTTDKIIFLIGKRRSCDNFFSFFLKFSVHIMHYSLIIILTGYLISYLYPAVCTNKIIVLNQKSGIPGTMINVMLQSIDIDYYHGNRLKFLNNRAYNIKADLLLSVDRKTKINCSHGAVQSDVQCNVQNSGKNSEYSTPQNARQESVKKSIGINRPFVFKSMSFTLKDFGPKYKYGMKQQPYLSLIIKRNPGIKLYFAGTLFFSFGLIMYLYQLFVQKYHKSGHKENNTNRLHGGYKS